MKKIIKKTGNSACLIINKEDLKIYELAVGDIVEVHLRKPTKNELNNGDIKI